MTEGSTPAESGKPSASGISLSFAGRSRPAARGSAARDSAQDKELITGFAEGQSEAADAARLVQKGKLVIARQDNTFAVSRGPRGYNPNRFLPDQDEASRLEGQDRFELAAPEEKPARQYGLQQRKPAAAAEPSEPSTATPVGTEGAPAGLRHMARPQHDSAAENGDARGPAWMQARRAGRGVMQDAEADILRRALESMPDMATVAEYGSIPVEAFGEAMLRGMGWTEGKALGRRDLPDVTAPEYVRRPEKLGLGAQPSAPPEAAGNKRRRPGEDKQARKDLVYIDPSGVQRNVKPAGAALVERPQPGPRPGKRMRVTSGAHSGLLCTVLSLGPSQNGSVAQEVQVRLHPSEAKVAVPGRDLGELSDSVPSLRADANGHRPSASPPVDRSDNNAGALLTKHEHKRARKEKDRQRKEAKREKKRQKREGHGRSRSASDSDREEAAGLRHTQGLANGGSRERSWLASHIMVKIIDKHLKGGRLYLKRAQILDVRTPTTCDIHVSESRETIAGVSHNSLETAVPHAAMSRVLLLQGPHARQQAKLLERSADGAVTVQLLSDFSVVIVGLDDVAEYVGPEGEDE